MTKAVEKLLAASLALLEDTESAELLDARDALNAISEDANGNSDEFKTLKAVVELLSPKIKKQ